MMIAIMLTLALSMPKAKDLDTKPTGHWRECGPIGPKQRYCQPRVERYRWPFVAAKVWTGSTVPVPLMASIAAIETGGDAEVYARKDDPNEIQRGMFSILCIDPAQRGSVKGRFSWLTWLRKADPALSRIQCSDLDGSGPKSAFLQAVSVIRILEHMKAQSKGDFLYAAVWPFAGKGQTEKGAAVRRRMLVKGMEVFGED